MVDQANSNGPAPWANLALARGKIIPMYASLVAWDNLYLAYRKAARGKRGHPNVAQFEYRLEENLIQLQEELADETYQPGPYHSFYIHEPKKRLISAAPFRDRVVHHALCLQIEPVFERSFIHDSYANRIGKGTHRALDRAQAFARKFAYVLICDIESFFPAIDHAILLAQLKRKIVDPKVVRLVQKILHSGRDVLQEEYAMRYFPGDDLFAVQRPRGLPIGNLTSQFWANCYLNPLDHFIKRALRCRGYLRYVDDFLLFSNQKVQLWSWKREIIRRLATLRLTLHPQAQPQPVSEGIPFLGFRLFPERRRLKNRKGVYYQRKLNRMIAELEQHPEKEEALLQSVQGWANHVRYASTIGLRKALFKRFKAKVPPQLRTGFRAALGLEKAAGRAKDD
jgi:retron-type reverse transcriptase